MGRTFLRLSEREGHYTSAPHLFQCGSPALGGAGLFGWARGAFLFLLPYKSNWTRIYADEHGFFKPNKVSFWVFPRFPRSSFGVTQDVSASKSRTCLLNVRWKILF